VRKSEASEGVERDGQAVLLSTWDGILSVLLSTWDGILSTAPLVGSNLTAQLSSSISSSISSSMKAFDVLSLLVVGAFWGCTNPFLRKGSSESTTEKKVENDKPLLLDAVKKFQNYRVWLPFALNQAGSLVYYVLLASSDLTLAVPICNGLALVFSCFTSFLLGERVDKPFRAFLGASLVMLGTALCMVAQEEKQ